MPLQDEYPRDLEPAGEVEAEGGVYDEAVDRKAADAAYKEEVGVQEDMEAIRDGYHAWARECQTYMGAGLDEEGAYGAAVKAVRQDGFDPDPETVRRYCDRYSTASWDGFFISALLNESSHDGFILPGMGNVTYLGYRNQKDVTVEGSVENAAGMWMQGGTLTITGDAGQDVGEHLEGGTIELQGDGDIAMTENGRVEHVNGARRYTIPSSSGVLARVRDVLEGW